MMRMQMEMTEPSAFIGLEHSIEDLNLAFNKLASFDGFRILRNLRELDVHVFAYYRNGDEAICGYLWNAI